MYKHLEIWQASYSPAPTFVSKVLLVVTLNVDYNKDGFENLQNLFCVIVHFIPGSVLHEGGGASSPQGPM